MKKLFQLIAAVLIFGWTSLAFGQQAVCPFGSVSVAPLQGFQQNPPLVQQNACVDTVTGLLLFPVPGFPNPLVIPGNILVGGTLGAGSISSAPFTGPIPWVDPMSPVYGCKGDGTTDDTTCMQAAITAAIASNSGLFLPPGKQFFIGCTGGGADCLASTKAIEIFSRTGTQDVGSLIVPTAIVNTKHLLHLTTDSNTDGYHLHNFSIKCQGGTCDPLSLIAVDGSTNGIARFQMDHVIEFGTYGTDTCGFRVINPANNNGFFDSDIGPLNVIANGSSGLCWQRVGDDVKSHGNTYTGAGTGINITCVVGALGFESNHDTFVNDTAALHVGDACSGFRLLTPQAEGHVGVTGSNSAYIDFDCTVGNPCLNIVVAFAHKIAAVAAGIDGLRLNWVDQPIVQGNTFFRAGGGAHSIVVTANAVAGHSILGPNVFSPADTIAANVSDSASSNSEYVGAMAAGTAYEYSRGIAAPSLVTSTIINTGGTNGFNVPSIGQTDAVLVGTDVSQRIENKLNRVSVLTSDFTTTSATLATITGLSWTLNATNAFSYSFHCALSYSQATAAVANSFGIQAATNNPTNIFATAHEQITVGPPATFVDGVLATLATTTATIIGPTFTPGATATNYVAYLDGTIENPVTTPNTINIMVLTGNAADAITVKRGSYCELF